MREEDWMWEEQLPPPEELMPISQSLITPDLALAFDIPSGPHTPPHPSNLSPAATDLADSAGNSDEPARTLKRPRLVWTPQLHKRFVDAVAHLGIKNAVPKTIMQLMSVDGLTRENVASHLQKYRLYLKRMQSLSSGNGAGCGPVADAATEHLFASSPVPPHFLRGAVGGSGPEHFFPYVAVTPAPPPPPPHHHHPHHNHHHLAGPQFHRQFGGGGVNVGMNGQFEHGGGFVGRPGQVGHPRVGIGGMHGEGGMPGYAAVDDLESGNTSGGRKVLTLFPTGED
ncbi:hypothetical protein MLD38_004504 [Melastoma candidum]|uniref:Uncharacterized protein n=1 Tax=Melastoma candidum TaxID=119954 RepID=A0ACB9SAJ6_9MYRT|nr:hypothetical protein MLD38_004504 [Melastoma candidum]